MVRSAICCLIVSATVFVRGAASASAQGFFQMGQQANSGQLIDPPRAVMQLLREAERAIEQNRPSEAVVILGDLLQREPSGDDDDELSGQDFFLNAGDGTAEMPRRPTAPGVPQRPGQARAVDVNGPGFATPLRKTLFGEARKMLSALPPSALETYELRYGAGARELLQRSASTRDWQGVAEVRRRFFHSRAGLDATGLLAQRAISTGNPLEALRLLEILLSHPLLDAAGRDSVELLILATRRSAAGPEILGGLSSAASAASAESPAAGSEPSEAGGVPGTDAPASPVESADAGRERQVTVAGQAITAPAGEELAGWLAERFAPARPRRLPASGDILMFGSDPGRHENSLGQMPLALPRWIARAVDTPSQQRELEDTAEAMISTGDFTPPSWLPIKVGDQVLMRSVGRVYGVDFRSGKVIWQDPWFESAPTTETVDETQILLGNDSGSSLLKQRVWNDLPYGRMTSDGQRVYVLSDLSEVRGVAFNPLMGLQGVRPTDSNSNTLLALDIPTEGKLIWKITGGAGEENGWGEIFFLGPPLPLGDALYVMAETAGDIVLICLDASTRLERWRQQLVAIEGGSIHGDPIRRVAGATPSYHQGVLVCSTGAGVIVGVDVLDHSLIWALRFERNEAMNQQVMGARRDLSSDQLLQRWWDGTPRIVGDTVFVTPIESDRLFALDLFTGEKRWKEVPRAQRGSRYLAGVRDGTMILVGSDHVRAADARSGQRTWETPAGWLDAGEQIAGVGVFGMQVGPAGGDPQPAYFVSTTSDRILAVSLTDGSVLATRELQFPGGNLIAVNGQLLCQSATQLAVVHGERSLAQIVAAALEVDPDDFNAIVWQAELLLQQDELEESLSWLRRARAADPDDIHVQNLSIRAMLNALRKDFSTNVGLLPELEKLIDRPADGVELRKLQVRAALESGDQQQAMRRLIELSRLVTDDPTLATLGKLRADDPARQVALDHWLSARVAETHAAADESTRVAIQAAVATHLQSSASATTARIKRLLIHFKGLEAAQPLVQTLLDRYLQDGDYLAMERLILSAAGATVGTPDRLSPAQLTGLIEAYARGGLMKDALALWTQIPAGDRPDGLAAQLGLSDAEVGSLDSPAAVQPWGSQVSVDLPQEAIRIRGNVMGRPMVGKTKRMIGRSFNGWRVISDINNPLGLRDPLGTFYPIPLDGRKEDSARQAVFSGGLMVAMLPGELVGINLFEATKGQVDPVIWRRSWRNDGGSGVKPKSDATAFGDQIYRYFINGTNGENAAAELVLGPIVGDSFYVLQGGELIAYDAMTAEPRWRNLETPGGGEIVSDGDVVAIVSPAAGKVVRYDCRDGRRLSEQPFEPYQIWASTDAAVLAYRDLSEASRELVLLDPLEGTPILRQVFDGLSNERRVFGRVVEGTHVVTLAATGELLIWDIEAGRQVSDLKLDPIPNLRGLQVLAREDELVILPNTGETSEDRTAVALHTQSGQDHVRVDGSVIAVRLATGEKAWQVPLGSDPWGCTLTQASGSPLLLLSRSKSRYLTTGSRTKTLDVMAIDTRDGKPNQVLDHPIESFNNDIETSIVVQPGVQRVTVAVGSVRLEYQFQDASQPAEEQPAEEQPVPGAAQEQDVQ